MTVRLTYTSGTVGSGLDADFEALLERARRGDQPRSDI